MHIVYALTTLAMGGTERQVLGLAGRMAARGHAVSILVLKAREPDELTTELEVVHLDMRKSAASFFHGWRRGSAFLREFRPDVIHSHNFHGNMLARMMHASYRQARLISTIHNVYEGGRLRMLAYRVTDRFVDLNTAVSEAVADRFVRMKAVPRSKCVVVNNGIAVAEFAPDAGRRAATREQMGVNDEFVWLAVGRMTPAKDFPNLLQAFGQVWEKHSQVRLWIAEGESPFQLRKTGYGAAVVAHGTMENVRMLGLRRDIAALLDAADGFVLSSAWEGMPLAVGEAMAMGKPVVATDVGGVRELVGDAGVLVPAKNPDALAVAMLGVLRKPPIELAAMGRDARARIVKSFSMDAKADQWEALYGSMLR